jgi:hypothetical protein
VPTPTNTSYPAVATNAAWQKKKSLLDKGIKTNVGPALVEAEKKWKLIKFADLNDKQTLTTVADATSKLAKAKAADVAVKNARQAVSDALAVAKTQSTNKKLNSASRTALVAIVAALQDAHKRLVSMDDIVQLLTVDVNVITAQAMGTLTNLEVKQGSKILAHAKAAKLASNKTYEVTDVDWKVSAKAQLDYLKAKVSISAFDGTGVRIEKDMVIAGITGTDKIRLK